MTVKEFLDMFKGISDERPIILIIDGVEYNGDDGADITVEEGTDSATGREEVWVVI